MNGEGKAMSQAREGLDILVISHFCNVPEENGNDRFGYLSEMLGKDNNVEQVTYP